MQTHVKIYSLGQNFAAVPKPTQCFLQLQFSSEYKARERAHTHLYNVCVLCSFTDICMCSVIACRVIFENKFGVKLFFPLPERASSRDSWRA